MGGLAAGKVSIKHFSKSCSLRLAPSWCIRRQRSARFQVVRQTAALEQVCEQRQLRVTYFAMLRASIRGFYVREGRRERERIGGCELRLNHCPGDSILDFDAYFYVCKTRQWGSQQLVSTAEPLITQ